MRASLNVPETGLIGLIDLEEAFVVPVPSLTGGGAVRPVGRTNYADGP
jgi:hypothetical protein